MKARGSISTAVRLPGFSAALAASVLVFGASAVRVPAATATADFGAAGPYPVGARTVVLVDESREDGFAGGPRTLVTEVWYPATDASRDLPRMHFSDFFGPYLKEGKEAVRRDLGEIDRRFQSLAARGAPLRPGPWPLLVFSHGNGGFRHQNAFQMEHLASHGYVVASPDHTGNSRLSPLPSKAVGYDRSGRSRSANDRPRDVTFLIDRLIAPDRPEVEWLRGAVDRNIIGVLGHSFGGFTAVRLAEEDPRIKAILPMTVAFVAKPSSVPTLVMLGAQDRTVGQAGNLASRGYYLGCTGPHHLFVLRRGGHFTFTDMALLNPNFGDGIGRGKGADGEVMDFVPDRLGKEIINAYTLAFFERYLRFNEAAGRYLGQNHYPEELEWWDGDSPIRPEGPPAKKARL